MGKTPRTSDLISYLPKNAIENILMRLPLKEAVKTSVLSKTWQYKWVTIPQLVFDNYNLGWQKSWKENRNELFMIIHQILLVQHGPILKFTLSILEMESCAEIDHLLSFLTTKGLEELNIKMWNRKSHKLPVYLFSCLQLRHLSLRHCVFVPPPTFRGFDRLKCIEFCAIELAPDFCGSFITKCPLLERLTLHDCSNLDSLFLDAPSLKFLDFAGAFYTLIRFDNTPLLEKVQVDFGFMSHMLMSIIPQWFEELSSLPSLDFLDLGCLQILPLTKSKSYLHADQLPSNFNLSILVLPKLFLIAPSIHVKINLVLRLIIICPNLRKLKIEGFSDIYNIDDDLNAARLFQGELFSNVSLSHLLEVEILCAYGTNLEMEFVKLLLAKSPVLKRMIIWHSKGKTADQKLRVLEKALQLRRASPAAEVFFLDPDAK